MKTTELIIVGMTCNHCVMAVQKELAKIPGVQIESVQIGEAKILYDEAAVREEQLVQAVTEAGYMLITAS